MCFVRLHFVTSSEPRTQQAEIKTSVASSIEPAPKRQLNDEVLTLSLGMIENRSLSDWAIPTSLSPALGGTEASTSLTSPLLQKSQEKKLPAIPVWPPSLNIVCQDLKGELYLDKLYVGNDGKLDPRTQSILWQGVWMTPREFEVQSGRGKHKNWKYSVRFNNRPVREVLSDIEKAFALGYPRTVVFSGSEPPVINRVNQVRTYYFSKQMAI